jgi:hypothetical protein
MEINRKIKITVSHYEVGLMVQVMACKFIFAYLLILSFYGQETCPKHVESYSKNKFEKLVHPIGFVIRIKCFILFIR